MMQPATTKASAPLATPGEARYSRRMRLFTIVLLAAAPLAAQRPDSLPPDTVTLAPTTVLGTRSPHTPFALAAAFTRVALGDRIGASGYGLNDALAFVPGVNAQSRYGSSDIRVTIRGFGARGAGDRSNAGTSRGIRVLLDGFPETEPDGRTAFDAIDLAVAHQVEVVRSNASATWGNAAGGVISVSTVPDFERPFATLAPQGGAYGLRRGAVSVGTPLGLGRALGSFVRTDFDGWRVHSASARSLLNVSLTTPVAERTRLGVFAVAAHNLFRIPGPLTAAEATADPRQANATYLARDERRDNRVARLGTTLDHVLSDRTSVSAMVFVNPKVLHRSERGTYRDFTRFHVGGNVVGRIGGFTAGIDHALQDGAILFYSLTPAGTRGDTTRANKREGARNLGVFVQQEIPVGERVGLTLGARWDDIAYDYQDFLDPTLDARKSFTGLTPKLGVTVRLAPLHSVYAAIGGGVEAPAGNETDPAGTFGQDTVTAINPLLDPIRSTTFEVGTRHTTIFAGDGLLRDLSYDVALYRTEVRNEIVPYRGGRFYFTAGRVRRSGAELGLSGHVAGGLTLQTALTFAHHRYTRYVVDSVHYGVPGATADYSGNQVVGVPAVSYAVGAAIAPAALRPLLLQVDVQGTSSYFADDANQVTVPRYAVTNLTVGMTAPVLAAGVAVRGFITVNNLFDRANIASAFLNPDVVGGVPVAFEPGLPRALLVAFTFSAGTAR